MKHLLPTLLMVAATSCGAYAQSVVIVDNEGLPHKFATDRIQDITFIKVDTPQPGDVTFNQLTASPYSFGEADLVLTAEDGTTLGLAMFSPSGSTYLADGVYSVADQKLGTDVADTYLVAAGSSDKTAVTDGSVTVSHTEAIYTLTIDLTLQGGAEFKGKYIGEIPNYGYVITLEPLSALKSSSINDKKEGEFYLKGNDSSWHYEMALDIFAAADATTLPAGTYTFAETSAEGTFGPSSYLDLYSSYFIQSNCRFATGSTITVSYDGDEATVEMHFILTDGRKANATFKGKITY